MARSNWRPVGLVDFARLRGARMQAHYAAQWLARTARAYIPQKPDDGHTNLGWHDSFDGFISHPFAQDHSLGLSLRDLTLTLLKNGQAVQSFSLHGHNETEARAWLGERMRELQLSPEALDNALPYGLPSHPLARGSRYDASEGEALHELAAWYSNGFHALSGLREHLVSLGLPAPEVRLWPHHFDLDCLTVIGDGAAYAVPTVGAGFSAGDHFYEEPYFYLSLYPRPDPSALPKLAPPGHWHTQDFLAAVAPASAILALRDRQPEAEAFLHSAADGIVKVLCSGTQQPSR